MNTYEFSQEPNKGLPFLIIVLGILVTFLLLFSYKEEREIKKEYTVSAIVYFQDGKIDTVSSTVISRQLPQYSLVIRSKKTYLWLFKDRNNFDIIATNVTHFKQIK